MQIFLGEIIDILDTSILLFKSDKKINCKNFLVRELWFRIIAVSLAVIFERLFVPIANKRINFYKF